MKELKINERFEAACPPLSREEEQELEELILRDGVIYNPILIWDDVIIDGHNRFFIAKRHNLDFTTRDISFKSDDEAIIWIKQNAISQRNLNDFVKCELAADIEKLLKEIGKQNQGKRTDLLSTDNKKLVPHNTREELAKKIGVSGGQQARAKVLIRDADSKTKQKLRKGNITIGQAYNEVVREKQWKEANPDYCKIASQISNDLRCDELPKGTDSRFNHAVHLISRGVLGEGISITDQPKLAAKIKKRIIEDKLTPSLDDMKTLIYQEHFHLDEYTIRMKSVGNTIKTIEGQVSGLSDILSDFNSELEVMKVEKMGLGKWNDLDLRIKLTRLIKGLDQFGYYLGFVPVDPEPGPAPTPDPTQKAVAAPAKKNHAVDIECEQIPKEV